MKSRRVLQIFVGALSIILLACLALFAALMYLHDYLSFIPQRMVDIAENFKAGLKTVSDKFYLYDEVVPAVFFGVPSLLLLLAIILILTKNNGKDGKNIAGCIFALLGSFFLTAFMLVFAKDLFATEILLIACCVVSGVLALFVLFIGLALGIKPKKRVTAEAEATDEPSVAIAASTTEVDPVIVVEEATATEEATAAETAETEEATETVETAEDAVEATTPSSSADEADETADEEAETEATPEEVEEVKSKIAIEEKLSEVKADEDATDEEGDAEEATPATEYVPHETESIRDVVNKTYGKDDELLSSATLQKLSKVRALYEAKVISEQEYIKLIHKYLGF